MNILYKTRATSVGGRGGHAETDDGLLKVNLVRPKELGGTGVGGTNPEQLFACGYAACFVSTIEHIARQKKVAVEGVRVDAEVGMGQRPQGGLGLTAELTVHLPGVDRAVAEDLVNTAHHTCPYSNAIHGNVDVVIRFAD